MARAERSRYEVLVLPRASLVRTAVTTALASLGPVLVALLLLAAPSGAWVAVLGVAGVVTALCLAAWARFRLVFAGVTPTHVVKRSFLVPLREVPRGEIAQVVRVETFRGHSSETVSQLLGLDADGCCRYRMRGTFWSDDALDGVVEALDVPVERRADPVPLRVLYRTWPDCRYWFEGRRWLVACSAVVGAAVVGGLLVLLYRALTPA